MNNRLRVRVGILFGILLLGLTGCSTEQSMVEPIANQKNQQEVTASESAQDADAETDDIAEEITPSAAAVITEEAVVTESDVLAQDSDSTNGVTPDPDVDVDLTILSSNMVYAEVYNMMVRPDDYMGKKVKIRGVLSSEYWEETQETYHYVIITDALACCQSGIEFIWDENKQEYPEDDSEVEVTGVFQSYEELDQTYYYLEVTKQPEVLG